MPSTGDKRRAFRQLHESGCFVIPNPWDVGSARVLEQRRDAGAQVVGALRGVAGAQRQADAPVLHPLLADLARYLGFTLAEGGELSPSTPEEFAAFIRSEIDQWAPVVRASGAKVD